LLSLAKLREGFIGQQFSRMTVHRVATGAISGAGV